MHERVCQNKVWGKVRSNPRMTCTTAGKPILDLGIYTKNKTFRIPGSCKTALPKDPTCDPNIPLPSKAFFMNTRMADRRDSLGTIPRPFFLHSETTNRHTHTLKKGKGYHMTLAMRVETEDGKTHNQPHVPNWRQYLEKIKRELR